MVKQKSRAFAVQAHGDQTYTSPIEGEKPYWVHLDHTVEVLERFGYTDPAVIAGGYLHDAIEDTRNGRRKMAEAIRQAFGDEVLDIVQRVTNPRRGPRREKHARTYPRTRENPKAVLVKLADRIANVEHAKRANPGLFKMYRGEQARFEEYLYRPGEYEELWAYLRRLIWA